MVAESYVRRCVEDELRMGRVDGDESDGLRERVRALVVVGLLDRGVARGILSGYARARALRGFPGYYSEYSGSSGYVAESALAGQVQRVCGCVSEVQVAGATVFPRLVALGARRTRLAVTLRLAAPPGGPGRRGHRGGPPDLTLRDDTGRSVTASVVAGSGGSDELRAWYQAEPGLSPTTGWIEIGGTRVVLRDTGIDTAVRVENLISDESSVEQRATRYLEHCADFIRSTHDLSRLAAATDALTACGALARDSPAVQQTLQAAYGGPGRPAALRPPAGLRSARHGRRAVERTVLVGVTTPAFDGVSVGVTELSATRDGFTMELDAVGDVEVGHRSAGIDATRLTFSAEDDLGNRYHGSIGEFSAGDLGFSGRIEFDPWLAAEARALEVVFSTERARAMVHIPLDEQSGGDT